MKMTHILILLAVVAVFIMYEPKKQVHNDVKWTVYGTNGCGWTRKQLKHMDDKGIAYKYVQCDKENCGSITAYPTLKHSSGKVIEGFSSI